MVSIIDVYKNNVSPITIYLKVACEKDYKIFCVQLTLFILKINLPLLKLVCIMIAKRFLSFNHLRLTSFSVSNKTFKF